MENSDEQYFQTYISNFEDNFDSRQKLPYSDVLSISSIKIYLTNICNLNKRLKFLNDELKITNFSANWITNAKLSKILMIKLKMFLKKIKYNKFEVHCSQLKQINNLRRRIIEKKKGRLYRTRLHNKDENFDAKINIWMKEQQNKILEEKEKKNLKKDADIMLADIRIKRITAKKCLLVLQELNLYRKLKVDITRISGNLISTEVNHIIHNIFTKLIYQWKTLSREYSFEEKGLKLMMESDNVDKALRRTKNVFYDWEINLFKKKISETCLLKENNRFLILRIIWDNFLENNAGNEIPTGWIIPRSLTSCDWIMYTQ